MEHRPHTLFSLIYGIAGVASAVGLSRMPSCSGGSRIGARLGLKTWHKKTSKNPLIIGQKMHRYISLAELKR
jgi:hypothetical protein